MTNPAAIVAYVLLFAAVGAVFIVVALILGKLLRPKVPGPHKSEIYECGEPTVGSGFVQFDLRFYVVALLFLVFDVEAAFFFPWAVVFGTAAKLGDPQTPKAAAVAASAQGKTASVALTAEARSQIETLGVAQPELPVPTASAAENTQAMAASFRSLARMAMLDVAVFFGVLLVGFAYIWKQGDLNWVRAIGQPAAAETPAPQEAVPVS